MTLFEEIDIINKKTRYPTDEEIYSGSQWMINKMFSCSPYFFPLSVEMNKFQTIDSKMHFDSYFFGIPKNKNFIQYNAKKQKADEQIKMIMEFYNCNQEVAKDYSQLISKEDMKRMEEYFKNRGRK